MIKTIHARSNKIASRRYLIPWDYVINFTDFNRQVKGIKKKEHAPTVIILYLRFSVCFFFSFHVIELFIVIFVIAWWQQKLALHQQRLNILYEFYAYSWRDCMCSFAIEQCFFKNLHFHSFLSVSFFYFTTENSRVQR